MDLKNSVIAITGAGQGLADDGGQPCTSGRGFSAAGC